MKSDSERGPVGAWARNARLAAGYTSAEHAVEAAEAQGFHITIAYLRGIEAGWHRPGRALLARLGELYDAEPPVPEQPRVSPEVAAEIREAVAAGVAEGVARALDAIARAEPSTRPRPRSR